MWIYWCGLCSYNVGDKVLEFSDIIVAAGKYTYLYAYVWIWQLS